MKHTKKFLKFLKMFFTTLFYIVFTNGMIISVILWNNAQLLAPFYINCPYNFNIEDIPRIFNEFSIENKKEIKNQCESNRCFLNNLYKNIK